MLKLTASYGKKVPVEGRDFSSKNYHATVEVEIPEGLDRTELDARIRDTFELVRTSVETELADSAGQGSTRPIARTRKRPAQPASEKQLSYLRDIAVRQGMTPADLAATASEHFGVAAVEHLAREQASQLIDELGGTGGGSQGRGRRAA